MLEPPPWAPPPAPYCFGNSSYDEVTERRTNPVDAVVSFYTATPQLCRPPCDETTPHNTSSDSGPASASPIINMMTNWQPTAPNNILIHTTDPFTGHPTSDVTTCDLSMPLHQWTSLWPNTSNTSKQCPYSLEQVDHTCGYIDDVY